MLKGLVFGVGNSHEIDVAQLHGRIGGCLYVTEKLWALLQRLPYRPRVIFLEDRDLVSFETQRSETYSSVFCIFVTVSFAKVVARAEIDNSGNTIHLNTGHQGAVTCQAEA